MATLTDMRPVTEPPLELHVRCGEKEDAAKLRKALRQMLAGSVAREVIDEAVLVFTELYSNALRVSSEGFTVPVDVTLAAPYLWIQVGDDSAELAMRTPMVDLDRLLADDAIDLVPEKGRGLLLACTLAEVTTRLAPGGGKTTCAMIELRGRM